MLLRKLLPVAVAVAAVAGCSEEATVPSLGDQVIALTVAPSLTTLSPGQVTTITATLTNTLGEAVALNFATTCQILFFVRNETGRVVTPSAGHNCPQVPSQLSIAALGSVTRTVSWDGRAEFGADGATTRLPAGRYFVSAQVDALNYRTLAFPVLVTLVD